MLQGRAQALAKSGDRRPGTCNQRRRQMSAFLLSQVLIGIVFFIDMASFQFRERRYVLLCLGCSAFLIGVHFYLLDAYTAAVLGVVAAVRFVTAIYTNSKWLLMLFLAVVLGNGILTYAGELTVLATCGSVLSTCAAFLASDRGFRKLMMASSVIWIFHNVLAYTPAGVALETVFLGSNLLGYYRHYYRRRKDG
jgi:hypothetical protein